MKKEKITKNNYLDSRTPKERREDTRVKTKTTFSKNGIRHSDKCSDKELQQFKKDVCNYLNELKLEWKTLRAFNCFGGQVKVYTGKTVERMPLKSRRRLIAFKDTDGQWQSNSTESIQNIMSSVGEEHFRGSQVWQYHSEPITEPECFSLFRSEWYSQDKEIADNERSQLKEFLEMSNK